jgi:putative DNA methylase
MAAMASSNESLSGQERTYRRGQAVVFLKTKEAFGGLSNMASGFPLRVNGVPIRSSEALYQACRFPHMPELQRRVIAERSPMTAKMVGKPYRDQSRPDWDRRRVAIMRWCLRVKLAQNFDTFSRLLLATGEGPIVEESRKDPFWGARPLPDDSLSGRNILGRLLMELREEVRSGERTATSDVPPLDIPDFLLMGEPISAVSGQGAKPWRPEQPDMKFATKEPVLSKAYRKKLIEVSLPLDAINAASAREKSIRHGHPSTLHLWWARRPLAACRAVLFAQLVDDPSSCTDEFPTLEAQEAERQRLHGIIEAMVPWEASTNEMILHSARYEIARSVARNGGPALTAEWRKLAHQREVIDYLQAHAPPVHDPFSGGGSIPLEAQRLGLRARGSDLNPVAVLIGKALVEFPPKFANMPPVNPDADRHVSWKGAKGLAKDVRYYGRWMREQAARRIGHLYPKAQLPDGGEATVVAWLWARTVPSPDPRAKGAHVPLASSFVLSAKKDREVIVRPVVDREALTWTFMVDDAPSPEALAAAKTGTKAARGANFVCVLTGAAIDDRHIKAEILSGRTNQRMIAIVAEGPAGRRYLSPTAEQEELVRQIVKPDASEIDQPIPKNARWFSPPVYGMPNYRDLFTARQLTALTLFSDLIGEVRETALAAATENWPASISAADDRPLAEGGVGPTAYADAVATYLAFALSKASSRNCSLAIWETAMGRLAGAFGRQAMPMQWSFAETNPLAGAGGDIAGTAQSVAEVLEALVPAASGIVENRDAALNDFPVNTTFSTDPPYYDNVGYADLSDFFYVWLRRTAGHIFPDLFRRLQTPKDRELIVTPTRHGGKEGSERFFMDGMRAALAGLSKSHGESPVAIYYAFKQSEAGADGVTSAGWATFLQAVVDSGFLIDGTWPVRTEATNALKASISALASSIVLVCRRREAADTITRPDFLRRLRAEMPAALTTIRAAGVGPTDIQQAAIGPGIGIFTRYAAVLNTDGEPMSVRDALKLVNQVREEIASEGEGDYDADTRFAIDWFVAHGFAAGKAGDAIGMANAANLGLADLVAAGVLEAKGGVARLLRRVDMPTDWDPRKDKRPTAWEACQHLIRRLEAENGGIDAAAQLFAVLGDLTEPAHQLAFRLYDICEKRGWHADGRPYNLLIQEWAEIENRAFALRDAPPAQGEMPV